MEYKSEPDYAEIGRKVAEVLRKCDSDKCRCCVWREVCSEIER